ncbi:MAG TPA: aminopeptidase, partial [Brevundimonas sp.]|nr:aminopeptidase [Brevundimonas sp.]
MIRSLGLVSALALTTALGACASTNPAAVAADTQAPVMAEQTRPASDYVRDVHSHARPEIARVVHVALNLS